MLDFSHAKYNFIQSNKQDRHIFLDFNHCNVHSMLNPESNIFIYWHCLVIDDIESIICTRYKHDIFNEEIILSAYTKE